MYYPLTDAHKAFEYAKLDSKKVDVEIEAEPAKWAFRLMVIKDCWDFHFGNNEVKFKTITETGVMHKEFFKTEEVDLKPIADVHYYVITLTNYLHFRILDL